MKYKIHFFCSFCLFVFYFTNAQTSIKGLNACSFNLIEGKDSIQFIKVNKDLVTTKPTIIFCQGSLPIPLIIKFKSGDKIIAALNNFDYNKIAKTYNIIVISMPFTPIIADESTLNHQYAYVTDKNKEHSYSVKYLNANYLDNYVQRGNSVIQFLLKQKWVDKNHLIIVGHSQGALIATKIAAENKNISILGFLSGDPLGRVDQYVREARLLAQKGVLSQEKAQEEINKTYKWWEWTNQHAEEPSQKGEDSPKTTISFSRPVLDDLLKITIPIYIAYGTEDIAASYCDLLPLDFIRAGKSNYKIVPYLGLDHNYMEVDSLGQPIPEKCFWNKTMNDFINWIEKRNAMSAKN